MGKPTQITERDARIEWLKCEQSASYFIHTYCQIYDATESKWIPFHLWPGQLSTLDDIINNRLTVILKARQLGMTWLVLCYILWKMVFHPSFTALIFSRRETESLYLLGKDRLRGIYNRLPSWAQAKQVLTDASGAWQLSNGSVAYAFPTTAGDSYTASYALVDEADLVPDLDRLLNAVKPTIDGGGGMCLLSRVDKETPSSPFKRIYIGARSGHSPWKSIFLPWYTRPGRDQKWYDDQKADILYRTTALDDLYQQYPATDEEALKPPTMDRRLPYTWLKQCYVPLVPEDDEELGIPYLKIFKKPWYNGQYVIGADPAEGNPTSDDSVAHVLDAEIGEEVAVLAGKIEPEMFAEYLATLATWYHNAEILPERNNHGHAVILALTSLFDKAPMKGLDGGFGWMTSSRGKAISYAKAAEIFRDKACIIHSEETFNQLASIDGSTLRAPEGDKDDYAISYVLSLCAKEFGFVTVEVGVSPTSGYRG